MSLEGLIEGRRNRTALLVTTALAWALLCPMEVAAAQTDSSATWGADDKAAEDQVVRIVNQKRKQYGCGPVKQDTRLRTAASRHSKDMARRGYFQHNTPEGVSFVKRGRKAGYPSPGGENIARGQGDAKKVMTDWMNSTGHRENILNCDFTTIGVNVTKDRNGRRYWTQEFGR